MTHLTRRAALAALAAGALGLASTGTIAAAPRSLARGVFKATEDDVTALGSVSIVQRGGEFRLNLNADFEITPRPALSVWLSPSLDAWVDGAIVLDDLTVERGRSSYALDPSLVAGQFQSAVILSEDLGLAYAVAPLRWLAAGVILATGALESEHPERTTGEAALVQQGDDLWLDLANVQTPARARVAIGFTDQPESPAATDIPLGRMNSDDRHESFRLDQSLAASGVPEFVLFRHSKTEEVAAWARLVPVEATAPEEAPEAEPDAAEETIPAEPEIPVEEAPVVEPEPDPAPIEEPVFVPQIVASGVFGQGDEGHYGFGSMHIVEVGPGSFVVSLLNDFGVIPGPQLWVMLSPSPSYYADGAIALGGLYATVGSQDYAVPAGIDPRAYGSVIIWCTEYSVLISAAAIV